jgi:hypothetical protein
VPLPHGYGLEGELHHLVRRGPSIDTLRWAETSLGSCVFDVEPLEGGIFSAVHRLGIRDRARDEPEMVPPPWTHHPKAWASALEVFHGPQPWLSASGRDSYDPYHDLVNVVSLVGETPGEGLDRPVAAAAAQLR